MWWWWWFYDVNEQTFYKILNTCSYIPRSTILPNRFLPRKKFFVEQFHLRFRNWCWHSEIARFAPLTNAANTPGFSRTKRRCLRRSVVCMAGSMYTMLDVNGDILFGSPTFAMPLFFSEIYQKFREKMVINNLFIYLFEDLRLSILNSRSHFKWFMLWQVF